ncbi:MAG TPA: GSCFA domain-containing protein [Myxococcota bacterium]|nr:GSCFA domain-containing protein [Myxococcota bacterium]HRY92639.1 GSCFA domain-containing protein [Myxococcota bacterium]
MTNPYKHLPDQAFWRRAVANALEVDPVIASPLQITPADKVATAGSCFAQHIARHLKQSGFNYFVTEPAHELMSEKLAIAFNYGTFSARYGNIYTSAQLRQLICRAFNEFVPIEGEWKDSDGHFVDPFRPQIQPGGFLSVDELRADRSQHLGAVRTMLQELDYFVFTLGLTECWLSTEDGAVFPLCPGVAGGSFDAKRYVFKNLSVTEITNDMLWVIDRLRSLNPKARTILTVSPVPLVATAVPGKHVLVSTTYSKAVLRVAAEEIIARRPDVAYFPSYEVITGAFSRGKYFAEDLRSVTEEGISHVMRIFFRHFTSGTAVLPQPSTKPAAPSYLQQMMHAVEVNCEEEALDPE